MTDAAQGMRRKHNKLRLIFVALAVLLILLIVPPLIGVGRYKNRITAMLSQSFGRPVRLSSVELRLLPLPGFVLTDLTVAEDPAYGFEPVLHADTVKASIRLLPLWRGRLEIGTVSVDDASLNVVRTAPGKWNLDPLFRTAAAKAGTAGGSERGPARRFPYLEATNSRINFKNGAEKLPFSLINTDLSFWQESPGEWRVRLRGQPARTDVALDLADTGVVRLEASIHSAQELHLMPLHADLDWRQAQLGQLSRLLVGDDPGWRGDLTGELHLDGTPAAAHVTARLRATGVHRAEFAPASPLDFDANCGFVYHYALRTVDHLACNSPFGDGTLHLTGNIPGANAAPNLTLELDRISIGAGADILRTLRSDINPDLQATGIVNGKLIYSGTATPKPIAARQSKPRHRHANAAAQSLTGSLTIEGFALSGAGLEQPLRAPKVVLEPALQNGAETLAGAVTVPAGAATPLTVSLKLALDGYEAGLHGQMSIARARELAKAAGLPGFGVLNSLAGEPLALNLTANGPWWPGQQGFPQNSQASVVTNPSAVSAPGAPPAAAPESDEGPQPSADILSGTISLHNANWRADFLANRVQIAEATLHVSRSGLRLDPVAFSYGPVKGTGTITLPVNCTVEAASPVPPAAPCQPHFDAQFGALNAELVQAALLGAHRQGTLLSDLLDRLSPQSVPPWPAMQGTVKAASVALGPLSVQRVSASVKIADESAVIENLTCAALGGRIDASGRVQRSREDQTAAPQYNVTAHFNRLNAAAVGQLLASHWSGGPISGDAKVELAGFTSKDLAASAKGTLHFDWRHGSIAQPAAVATDPDATAANAESASLPMQNAPLSSLTRFDRWSGTAQIGDGTIALGQNQLFSSARKTTVGGSVAFTSNPPKVRFDVANPPLQLR